jgi:beta-phosphoglucomutase
MVNNFDLVIFDMDGVIIDSEYHNLLMQQEVMAKDGVHVDIETLYPLVGLEWDLHFDHVLSFYDDSKTKADIRKATFSFLESVEIDYRDLVFDGVVETIKQLYHQGIKIALASNSNYELLIEVLSQLEIEKYFSKINSAEFFELGKPHPAIYNDVVASLGVDRERVLVIEDSKSGIRAAKLAGLKVFAIRDDRFGMDQSEADAIISGVLELFDK